MKFNGAVSVMAVMLVASGSLAFTAPEAAAGADGLSNTLLAAEQYKYVKGSRFVRRQPVRANASGSSKTKPNKARP